MTLPRQPKDKIIGPIAIACTVKVNNFDALFSFENISIVKIIVAKVSRRKLMNFVFNCLFYGFEHIFLCFYVHFNLLTRKKQKTKL